MADDGDESDMKPAKKTMGFKGCAMIASLLGVLMLGGGISLMNRWNALGGGGKSAAIILVVLGTLVLLPFVLMLAIKYAIGWWMKSITKDFKNAAEEMAAVGDAMVGNTKAMYETIHTFRTAEEEDFEDVEPALYESAQRDLSSLGFRHLGDVVDETIEEISDVSPPIRIMASPDGTTTAGFYHFTPPEVAGKFGDGKPLLMIDLATEFADGNFLATANTAGLDLTTAATGIDRRQHPLETPIAELVRLHESEKQKLLAAKSTAGTNAVVINSLDAALESEKRQQALKNKFRKQIGYIDPEEVRRIAKNVDDDPAFGDMAARAADEARKNEQGS